ncbi:MAG TPA: citramalate synthase [Actinomycetota bacterium]|nr:citramalate synthase [Actinomycetota bacterium]
MTASANVGRGPRVELYDTTLRDGAQAPGLSYSVEDRMRILHKLDQLGVPLIEGGWPGANPRDTEFFRLATKEKLQHAELVAFGMTRRAGERAEESAILGELLDAGTEIVCFVGKSWDLHVEKALRTDLDEGVAMVRDTVRHLRAQGRRVFFDAEHFFDGYRRNPSFAMAVLHAAEAAGAERLVLCDTNGGTLPSGIARITAEVIARVSTPLGIHTHDDAGCAVAASLAAVEAGAVHVQGTVNGYGERCGNADIGVIAANLGLKLGRPSLPLGSVARLTELSHYVAEVANVVPDPHHPYVGRFAFTHKAGLHTAGVSRRTDAYEHAPPETVSNRRGVVVSDLGGRSTLAMKAGELGLSLSTDELTALVPVIKEREAAGYTFEVADATLELLMRRHDGWRQPFFEVESFRCSVDKRQGDPPLAEATVKVRAGGERLIAAAEGHGPVGALDNALRTALTPTYPQLEDIVLTDYRVRVLDQKQGTAAVVRVLIDSTNGRSEWTTVGVSDNVIEASWEALTDSLSYGLLHAPAEIQPEREPV